MATIFLSYSRRDAEWATQLAEALTATGMSIWLDVRDIPVSTPWLDEINDAIDECLVFVRCESVNRRRSEACAAESAMAEALQKAQVGVLVGDDLPDSVHRIQRVLASVGAHEAAATDLRIRAREWDRNGRGRRDLGSAGQIQRGEQSLRAMQGHPARNPALWHVAGEYVQAVRARARRRRGLAIAGAIVTSLVVLLALSLRSVQKRDTATNQQLAAGYGAGANLRRLAGVDPYLGLLAAARITTTDDDSDAELVQRALSVVVPDDAFDVATGAVGFAAKPVGRIVLVRSRGGAVYGRAATATATRDAAPTAPPHGDPPSAMRLGAVVDAATGTVTITRDGKLLRVVTVPGGENVWAFSPDQHWLAVAQRGGASIVDVDSGLVKVLDEGGPGAAGAADDVVDLAWSADGNRVWAVTGGAVVSWPFHTGTVVLERPGAWFQAVGRSALSGRLWTAARDGSVQEVEIRSGQITRRIQVKDTIYSAVFSGDGSAAFLYGAEHNWLVFLQSLHYEQVVLPGSCSGDPADFSPSGKALVLACGTQIRTLSVPSLQTEQVVSAGTDHNVTDLRVTADDRVLIGTNDGLLLESTPGDASATVLTQLECHTYIRDIAVSVTGDLLPVGDGDTLAGCESIGRSQGGQVTKYDHLIDLTPRAETAQAASFDATGTQYVVGYYDGTVVIRPTTNTVPAITIQDVDGSVRGMIVESGVAYVVTRTGVIEAITLPVSPATNLTQARIAAQRLQRAHDLGLTTLKPS